MTPIEPCIEKCDVPAMPQNATGKACHQKKEARS